jgi:hypothetical protein
MPYKLIIFSSTDHERVHNPIILVSCKHAFYFFFEKVSSNLVFLEKSFDGIRHLNPVIHRRVTSSYKINSVCHDIPDTRRTSTDDFLRAEFPFSEKLMFYELLLVYTCRANRTEDRYLVVFNLLCNGNRVSFPG